MESVRVFLSHDWGKDAANHARVAAVAAQLRVRNMNVWFDDTHMKGHILDAMCRGIDQSDVVVVFVTQSYVAKVASGDDTDNVRREFMYAAAHPRRLLPVRFDAGLGKVWAGPVGMILGSRLYVDLANDETQIDRLVQAIHKHTSRTMWKTAIKRVSQTKLVRVESSSGLVCKKQGMVMSPCAQGVAPVRPSPLAVRERVARAYHAFGDELPQEVHVGMAVDRLFASLAGTARADVPFVKKLQRIEHELGLEAGA